MENRSSWRMRTLVTQMPRSRPDRQSDRMRADIHDGREHNALQAEAGYIDARPPHRQVVEIFLRRTAGPYIGSRAPPDRLNWTKLRLQSSESRRDFRSLPI
jgi:hypothetical protein